MQSLSDLPKDETKVLPKWKARAHYYISAAAIAFLIAGIALSHSIEPGVRVKKIMLTRDIPALKFSSNKPGPHPIALLGHGVTGSKETLFRYGEALAAAGFECFSVDFPGHGESPEPFSHRACALTPTEAARALGSVDIYIGHSMGGGAGAVSVRNGGFHPKLFIAIGSNVRLGENGPPLLLLGGQFEEFIRPTQLKARTDARVVISPWSDHVLELVDPVLVGAAVEAACAATGKVPPAPPTRWRWRLAGFALGIVGALGLIFSLPEIFPRMARVRGFISPVIILTTLILTTGTGYGCSPYPHRVPLQIALIIALRLLIVGLGRLRLPRWTIAAFLGVLAVGCVIAATYMDAHPQRGENVIPFHLLEIITVIGTVLLCGGTILGWITARRGARSDGDLAMAIFAGYAIGQWILMLY